MKTSSQTFNISFPQALVQEIDAVAAEQFGSRSDFLRAAAIQYLKNEKEWDYIFREGKKIGAKDASAPEAEILADLTAQRRKSGRWHVR
ncbi:CopG family transcriptional regulator [Candidatus Saccharibacteria bacterium]|nr:MAG: CopG family transcriptional regulator [Candidatus Saccharibacteria bacterium]